MTVLYIQHDYAVFGFGENKQAAIAMAAQWIKNENGQLGCSTAYAESLLVNKPRRGQMTLVEIDADIPAEAENWGGEELLDWYYDVS